MGTTVPPKSTNTPQNYTPGPGEQGQTSTSGAGEQCQVDSQTTGTPSGKTDAGVPQQPKSQQPDAKTDYQTQPKPATVAPAGPAPTKTAARFGNAKDVLPAKGPELSADKDAAISQLTEQAKGNLDALNQRFAQYSTGAKSRRPTKEGMKSYQDAIKRADQDYKLLLSLSGNPQDASAELLKDIQKRVSAQATYIQQSGQKSAARDDGIFRMTEKAQTNLENLKKTLTQYSSGALGIAVNQQNINALQKNIQEADEDYKFLLSLSGGNNSTQDFGDIGKRIIERNKIIDSITKIRAGNDAAISKLTEYAQANYTNLNVAMVQYSTGAWGISPTVEGVKQFQRAIKKADEDVKLLLSLPGNSNADPALITDAQNRIISLAKKINLMAQVNQLPSPEALGIKAPPSSGPATSITTILKNEALMVLDGSGDVAKLKKHIAIYKDAVSRLEILEKRKQELGKQTSPLVTGGKVVWDGHYGVGTPKLDEGILPADSLNKENLQRAYEKQTREDMDQWDTVFDFLNDPKNPSKAFYAGNFDKDPFSTLNKWSRKGDALIDTMDKMVVASEKVAAENLDDKKINSLDLLNTTEKIVEDIQALLKTDNPSGVELKRLADQLKLIRQKQHELAHDFKAQLTADIGDPKKLAALAMTLELLWPSRKGIKNYDVYFANFFSANTSSVHLISFIQTKINKLDQISAGEGNQVTTIQEIKALADQVNRTQKFLYYAAKSYQYGEKLYEAYLKGPGNLTSVVDLFHAEGRAIMSHPASKLESGLDKAYFNFNDQLDKDITTMTTAVEDLGSLVSEMEKDFNGESIFDWAKGEQTGNLKDLGKLNFDRHTAFVALVEARAAYGRGDIKLAAQKLNDANLSLMKLKESRTFKYLKSCYESDERLKSKGHFAVNVFVVIGSMGLSSLAIARAAGWLLRIAEGANAAKTVVAGVEVATDIVATTETVAAGAEAVVVGTEVAVGTAEVTGAATTAGAEVIGSGASTALKVANVLRTEDGIVKLMAEGTVFVPSEKLTNHFILHEDLPHWYHWPAEILFFGASMKALQPIMKAMLPVEQALGAKLLQARGGVAFKQAVQNCEERLVKEGLIKEGKLILNAKTYEILAPEMAKVMEEAGWFKVAAWTDKAAWYGKGLIQKVPTFIAESAWFSLVNAPLEQWAKSQLGIGKKVSLAKAFEQNWTVEGVLQQVANLACIKVGSAMGHGLLKPEVAKAEHMAASDQMARIYQKFGNRIIALNDQRIAIGNQFKNPENLQNKTPKEIAEMKTQMRDCLTEQLKLLNALPKEIVNPAALKATKDALAELDAADKLAAQAKGDPVGFKNSLIVAVKQPFQSIVDLAKTIGETLARGSDDDMSGPGGLKPAYEGPSHEPGTKESPEGSTKHEMRATQPVQGSPRPIAPEVSIPEHQLPPVYRWAREARRMGFEQRERLSQQQKEALIFEAKDRAKKNPSLIAQTGLERTVAEGTLNVHDAVKLLNATIDRLETSMGQNREAFPNRGTVWELLPRLDDLMSGKSVEATPPEPGVVSTLSATTHMRYDHEVITPDKATEAWMQKLNTQPELKAELCKKLGIKTDTPADRLVAEPRLRRKIQTLLTQAAAISRKAHRDTSEAKGYNLPVEPDATGLVPTGAEGRDAVLALFPQPTTFEGIIKEAHRGIPDSELNKKLVLKFVELMEKGQQLMDLVAKAEKQRGPNNPVTPEALVKAARAFHQALADAVNPTANGHMDNNALQIWAHDISGARLPAYLAGEAPVVREHMKQFGDASRAAENGHKDHAGATPSEAPVPETKPTIAAEKPAPSAEVKQAPSQTKSKPADGSIILTDSGGGLGIRLYPEHVAAPDKALIARVRKVTRDSVSLIIEKSEKGADGKTQFEIRTFKTDEWQPVREGQTLKFVPEVEKSKGSDNNDQGPGGSTPVSGGSKGNTPLSPTPAPGSASKMVTELKAAFVDTTHLLGEFLSAIVEGGKLVVRGLKGEKVIGADEMLTVGGFRMVGDAQTSTAKGPTTFFKTGTVAETHRKLTDISDKMDDEKELSSEEKKFLREQAFEILKQDPDLSRQLKLNAIASPDRLPPLIAKKVIDAKQSAIGNLYDRILKLETSLSAEDKTLLKNLYEDSSIGLNTKSQLLAEHQKYLKSIRDLADAKVPTEQIVALRQNATTADDYFNAVETRLKDADKPSGPMDLAVEKAREEIKTVAREEPEIAALMEDKIRKLEKNDDGLSPSQKQDLLNNLEEYVKFEKFLIDHKITDAQTMLDQFKRSTNFRHFMDVSLKVVDHFNEMQKKLEQQRAIKSSGVRIRTPEPAQARGQEVANHNFEEILNRINKGESLNTQEKDFIVQKAFTELKPSLQQHYGKASKLPFEAAVRSLNQKMAGLDDTFDAAMERVSSPKLEKLGEAIRNDQGLSLNLRKEILEHLEEFHALLSKLGKQDVPQKDITEILKNYYSFDDARTALLKIKQGSYEKPSKAVEPEQSIQTLPPDLTHFETEPEATKGANQEPPDGDHTPTVTNPAKTNEAPSLWEQQRLSKLQDDITDNALKMETEQAEQWMNTVQIYLNDKNTTVQEKIEYLTMLNDDMVKVIEQSKTKVAPEPTKDDLQPSRVDDIPHVEDNLDPLEIKIDQMTQIISEIRNSLLGIWDDSVIGLLDDKLGSSKTEAELDDYFQKAKDLKVLIDDPNQLESLNKKIAEARSRGVSDHEIRDVILKDPLQCTQNLNEKIEAVKQIQNVYKKIMGRKLPQNLVTIIDTIIHDGALTDVSKLDTFNKLDAILERMDKMSKLGLKNLRDALAKINLDESLTAENTDPVLNLIHLEVLKEDYSDHLRRLGANELFINEQLKMALANQNEIEQQIKDLKGAIQPFENFKIEIELLETTGDDIPWKEYCEKSSSQEVEWALDDVIELAQKWDPVAMKPRSGNTHDVGDGLFEIRDVPKGKRYYWFLHEGKVILVSGGTGNDGGQQDKDIDRAKKLKKDYEDARKPKSKKRA